MCIIKIWKIHIFQQVPEIEVLVCVQEEIVSFRIPMLLM